MGRPLKDSVRRAANKETGNGASSSHEGIHNPPSLSTQRRKTKERNHDNLSNN